MRKKLFMLCLVIAVSLTPFGCRNDKQKDNATRLVQTNGYEKISPEDAKQVIDDKVPHTLLDVRSLSEYDEKHIPGALLIPSPELADRAASELPDPDMLILVYCQSGGRSKAACETLISLGYSYVKDMGGIDTWPYETE